MSPFVKGILGFFGCAAATIVVYQIGKNAGREETLREIEAEERDQKIMEQAQIIAEPHDTVNEPTNADIASPAVPPVVQPQTPVEKVRKMHGLKNKILGSGGIIKDLLQNPDNKKVMITVEDGDIVARISPK